MIRLSKLTDYGIVLMTQMARHPERVVHTARDLAAETRLPLPTVSKILKCLSNGGLLVSQRGVKGGYGLVRSAQEISVGQIISLLEGPIGVTECGSAPGRCDMESYCPVSSHWRVISHELRQTLNRLTLSGLVNPLPVAGPSSPPIGAMDLISGRTQ
jgi:FeS assembly SUF system regulator